MKELSIEEKAKRYDDAIKKAESLYKAAEPMSGCSVIIETLFPELKESEDERIRKELLEHCKNQAKPYIQTGNKCPQIYSWIAWLEKQAEHANFLNKIQIGDKVTRNEDGVLVNLSQLNRVAKKDEKQDEQKPANVEEVNFFDDFRKTDSEVEPKFHEGDIIKEKETGNLFYVNSIEDFGYTLHYKNCIEKGCTLSFKYEDNYELVEQKPADIEKLLQAEYKKGWDEAMHQLPQEVDSQIWQIANNSAKTWEESFAILNATQKAYDKGKNDALKAQHNAWSEEDEKMLKIVIETCVQYGNEYAYYWLKSLKDKYTWKPSNEQMVAIQEAMNIVGILTITGCRINSLYQDLKKLKGK